jgi:hypothetical protein
MYRDLSLAAQTAYAQLFDAAQSMAHQRSIANVPGSFNWKQVGGKDYCYYQSRGLDGLIRQTYLSPSTERLNALLALRKATLQPGNPELSAFAKNAVAHGCDPVSTEHHRVITKLESEGFFFTGGVLVGAHAFLASGNVLGVHWALSESSSRANNTDHQKKLTFAGPAAVNHRLVTPIEKLEAGFTPINSLSGFTNGVWKPQPKGGIEIQLITSPTNECARIAHLPAFSADFRTLPYLDCLLRKTIPAVIFSKTGRACLVTIPDPVRLAVYGLLVAGSPRSKESRDTLITLDQTLCLVAFFCERDVDSLQRAFHDVRDDGITERQALTAGVAAAKSAAARAPAGKSLLSTLTNKLRT